MAETKRYALTPEAQGPFWVKDNRFTFRVGFGKDDGHVVYPPTATVNPDPFFQS